MGVNKSKEERDKSLTVVWGEVEACMCLGSLIFIESDSLLGKDSSVQFSLSIWSYFCKSMLIPLILLAKLSPVFSIPSKPGGALMRADF